MRSVAAKFGIEQNRDILEEQLDVFLAVPTGENEKLLEMDK
jgi:hypothetical protein